MADRILLLLGPSDGGIRRHVATLRDELHRTGHTVRTAGPAGVLDGLGGIDDVVPIATSPVAVARSARLLRQVVETHRIDVVHAHGLKAAFVAVAARVRPRILTVHNVVLDDASGRAAPLLRRVERALPARMDATIVVSAEMRRHFPDDADIDVIAPAGPRPVPQRTPAQVRADLGIGDAPLVVTVARMHPQKDLPTLLDAAVAVRERRPDVRFVVVGGGPEESAVRARHHQLGLDGTVLLLGQQPSAADELAAADLVAMSSIWEGSPLVVAEAMLLGRPVVSTAVGAVPDAITDGVHGRLVPPRDPDALADAVVAVLADPGAAAAMGAAARAEAERRFAPDVLAAEVAARYRAVRR